MLFNSFSFLLFFPLVTLGYFIIPQRARPVFLLFSSYFFYMCWNAGYVLLLIFATLVTYLSALGLCAARAAGRKRLARAVMLLAAGADLGCLFYFKYFQLAVETLAAAAGLVGVQAAWPSAFPLLPVGISFYVFQSLGYLLDIWHERQAPCKNMVHYALFVSFFPQLVAGPIERSTTFLPQLAQKHRFDWDRVRSGLWLMLWGYFAKLVIADRAAILVSRVYGDWQSYSQGVVWAAVLLFAIQLYCDFAGYSAIAIGAAQVMGFQLMQNFRQPYFAVSITDFWRRWHISLSTWFRDYLYFPLGGSRGGERKTARNLMLTFLASGLWHGANWNFVVWGGIHGAAQVVERRLHLQNKGGEWFRLRRGCGVFLTYAISLVFFYTSTLTDALGVLGRLVGLGTGSRPADFFGRYHTLVLAAALVVLFLVDLLHEKGISLRGTLAKQNTAVRVCVVAAALGCVVFFGVYGAAYDASKFIYFQF